MYRGVLEGAVRFMVRWHENEATLSRKRPASIMGGVQGNGEERGNFRRETAVDESRKDMARRGSKVPSRLVSRTRLCYSYRRLLRLLRM